MTTFGPLSVKATGTTRNGLTVFQLTEDFHAVDDVRGEIVVSAGYKTDFASIPWGVRWLFHPDGKVSLPALLHDWVVARGVTENTVHQRRWATGIFNRAMKASGVPSWKRWPMIAYVALFTFSDLYL